MKAGENARERALEVGGFVAHDGIPPLGVLGLMPIGIDDHLADLGAQAIEHMLRKGLPLEGL